MSGEAQQQAITNVTTTHRQILVSIQVIQELIFAKMNNLFLFYYLLFLLNPICGILGEANAKISFNDLSYKPEQVHLSLGSSPTEIYVTWSTLNQVNYSQIEYRAYFPKSGTFGPIIKTDTIERINWLSHEDNKTRQHHTYRAKLVKLDPGNWYEYWISSWKFDQENSVLVKGKSFMFLAKDVQMNTKSKVKIALYGDLGLINGQSIERLSKMVSQNAFDLVIHNGDFAYDLDRYQGEHGDKFMRMIEPIAARLPYQTSVGNHEIKEKFLHYDQRFTMVDNEGVRNNFYYSFNAGPIHFIAISTEFYYFIDYLGMKPVNDQFNYLQKELEFANSPSERAKRPWVILFGHRPMYCSSNDNDDCTKETNLLRNGLPFTKTYALEELFYKHGVDVLFWSHEHQYERFLPLYDNQILNGTDEADEPYHNPRGPVHIISGSAGCEERIDNFTGKVAPGSVIRISDYGFSLLSASRRSLSFEQISDDQAGTVVDSFVITKSKQNFPPQ